MGGVRYKEGEAQKMGAQVSAHRTEALACPTTNK